MNPTLASALLAAALGLALGFAPRRALAPALAVYVVMAFGVSFASLDPGFREAVFVACWISVAGTAASVYLPRGAPLPVSIGLALNAGLWTGALTLVGGARLDLIKALPLALISLPATWIVARGWGIAVKVVASWLIAIALLAIALSTVPTPGYMPDHRD